MAAYRSNLLQVLGIFLVPGLLFGLLSLTLQNGKSPAFNFLFGLVLGSLVTWWVLPFGLGRAFYTDGDTLSYAGNTGAFFFTGWREEITISTLLHIGSGPQILGLGLGPICSLTFSSSRGENQDLSAIYFSEGTLQALLRDLRQKNPSIRFDDIFLSLMENPHPESAFLSALDSMVAILAILLGLGWILLILAIPSLVAPPIIFLIWIFLTILVTVHMLFRKGPQAVLTRVKKDIFPFVILVGVGFTFLLILYVVMTSYRDFIFNGIFLGIPRDISGVILQVVFFLIIGSAVGYCLKLYFGYLNRGRKT